MTRSDPREGIHTSTVGSGTKFILHALHIPLVEFVWIISISGGVLPRQYHLISAYEDKYLLERERVGEMGKAENAPQVFRSYFFPLDEHPQKDWRYWKILKE